METATAEKTEKAVSPAKVAEAQDCKLLDNFKETSPAMMAELTRMFIKKTDFKSRSKFRLQMKSVLDMLSVDTTYPKAKKEDADASATGPRPEGEGRSYENDYVPEPARMNDNILGGEDQ